MRNGKPIHKDISKNTVICFILVPKQVWNWQAKANCLPLQGIEHWFHSTSAGETLFIVVIKLSHNSNLNIFIIFASNGRSSNLKFQNIRFSFWKILLSDKPALTIHLYFYNVVTATYMFRENIPSILEFVLKMAN